MDLIQALCYRVLHLVYWWLSVLGVATLPLFSYDTADHVKDDEELPVFRGTYRQVVAEMQRERGKLLLLHFYSPQQPESKLVRRQVLGDQAFKSFLIGNADILFFPVSVESFAGWQLTFSFYCPETPSFVVVRREESGKLKIVGRCTGVSDVQSLLMLLRDRQAPAHQRQHSSEEADDELGSAPESNDVASPTSMDSSTGAILSKQLSDYETSLAKDRAKELDRLEREARDAHHSGLLEAARKERQEAIDRATAILEEEPLEGGTKIAVQLPNGAKILRRFKADCKAEQVYSFVDISYLKSDAALIDYRLQSLHPPFHVARTGARLSDYPIAGQHKLYVDLTPIGVTDDDEGVGGGGGASTTDAGNESDAED